MNFQSQRPVPDKKHGFGCLYMFLVVFLLVSPLTMAQSSSNNQQDQSQYAKFSPQMAIVIVILIAALFFMGFFSVYIRHCSESPSSNTARANGGSVLGRSRRAARGLDAAVISTFPTLEYSEVKEHKIGKGALECAVCLCEFEDGETLRLIPKCDHVFHTDCIDAWLASHTTCPVCRANLVPQPGESVHGIPQLQTESDVEAQHPTEPASEVCNEEVVEGRVVEEPEPAPGVSWLSKTLSRNRTRRSRSNRQRKLLRSHTTGHSVVQPGENMERFTLKLPVEVRNRILNRELQRASSMVVLPREESSRRGYRTGSVGSSSRGKYYQRLEKMDPVVKSDRWVFSMAPPFLTRGSSVKSVKVGTSAKEDNMERPIAAPHADSARPPI